MKINLIVVDDHKMFLDGITATLCKQKHINVLKALNNAKEALEVLKSTMPDLLITDISMPDINGLEFVKLVRKEYPNLKILVISMFRKLQAFEGINGYLLKETNVDELLFAINKIVIDNESCFYEGYDDEKRLLDFNRKILSEREKYIVSLIAKEFTTDQIAQKLFLSRYTIETHKKNIYMKLKVNNAAGLIKKAVYLGYIS